MSAESDFDFDPPSSFDVGKAKMMTRVPYTSSSCSWGVGDVMSAIALLEGAIVLHEKHERLKKMAVDAGLDLSRI